MATSEARTRANQANSAKSTGPKTPEGKERSRRNGLKHGMTGQGIVIPEADLAEVETRKAALEKELAPISVMGAILVGQMATLSIRMERGAAQEFAAVAARVRHAGDDFDAERLEQAELLLKSIGDDPRGNRRKLLKSPEGVDVLVDAWQDLRADLTCEPRPIWVAAHGVTMANLLGLRDADARAARIGALSRATWGNFGSLAVGDGSGLDEKARQAWARALLLEQIDAEIANLEAHYETLDFETFELDRAEAGARALFDASKEASLARRYESEARRGFFKSLKEFRLAEAEEFERLASDPPASTPPASTTLPETQMASSREEPATDPDVSTPETFLPALPAVSIGAEVAPGDDGRAPTVRRPIPAAA